MGEEIVAIIPAFNEELAIGSVILETKRYSDHVIVVNDGSSDRTAEIARLAGAEVISLSENSGKAKALMMGFQQARVNGFKAFVMLDGDGQHDPREIEAVVSPVLKGEADMVIGSRFLNEADKIPPYRKAGQKVLNGLTNIGTEQKITDSQSGFRALSPRAVRNLDFRSNGFGIESDMICQFASRGLKVKEVPISTIYDVPNKHTKHPVTHGLSVLGRIINTVSQSKPLTIVGVPGFILLCAGIFLGFFSLIESPLFEWGWLFQTFLAVFLFILGFVMCICALILNSLSELLNGFRKSLDRDLDAQ